MAEGFSRVFLPAVCGVEILFLACFFPCWFEMAEGFLRAFLPSGVSPGPITEVLGPDVPALAWLFWALRFGGVGFVVSWGDGGGGGGCGGGDEYSVSLADVGMQVFLFFQD
jgi:hypothetical protein